MIAAALADIDIAAHSILSHPPHFGIWKWASLQASEKVLKAYLQPKTDEHPWGHDLVKIARTAEEAGLTHVPSDWIEAVQCPACVRYGDPRVLPGEAVSAHYSPLRIARLVTVAPHKERRETNPETADGTGSRYERDGG